MICAILRDRQVSRYDQSLLGLHGKFFIILFNNLDETKWSYKYDERDD